MVEVECPLDGCEYEGSVRSVMNHITASAQEQHKGEHGQNYMEEIRERAEGLLNDFGEQAGWGDEQESEQDEEQAEQGGEQAEQETPSVVGSSGLAPAAAGLGMVGSFGRSLTEGDGPSGMQILGAVLLAYLLYSMLTSDGPSADGEPEAEESDYSASSPTDAFEHGGGLRG